MPNNDEAAGVFDVIATEEHQAPATPTVPEPKQKPVEAPKTEAKPETKTQTVEADAEHEEEATQDFSHQPTDNDSEDQPDTTEPSQTETKTETEPEVDWKKSLPPPPPEFALAPPQVNEEGQITNMTAEQYQQYIVEKAKAEMRQEAYTSNVENRALDEAEKILPEIKTNPGVRQMIQDIRTASIINGKQIDSFEAAKQVKALLSGYEAKGATNAKTQITIQKNSQVEVRGSSQKKATPSKTDKLAKRLKQGDDQAFAELFEIMDSEGKL